jgi:hypothetical protein
VDEDQAYNAGADGQLKKPFEASVMLKSLKDLIGGSDKKKRAGTTSLDLSYNGEEKPAKPESPSDETAADDSSGEKPVSALQAWLQQHDSGAYADNPASEAPAEGKPVAASAAADSVEETREDTARISNPQLLRRVEEEPEDLSLRNNPVARLRYSAKPSAVEARQAEQVSDTASDATKSGLRSFRIQPVAVPPEEPEAAGGSGEPARAPRKSLLEQLEEFENATSESGEELDLNTPFSKPAAATEVASVAESLVSEEAQKSSLQKEANAALAEQATEEENQAVGDSESDAGDGEEEFLLMRSRKGRSARPSLLETLGETEFPESILEASHVDPRPEDAAEAVASAPVATEASVAAAAAAVSAAQEAAAISLNDAGVRLDDEEVRAVVEIAVSAAMPTIVEEVSRCVLLALESRYADKASVNGDH